MISKISILAIATLLFLAPGIKGQECIPNQVLYLTITSSSVLIWEINPKEPCPIDEYVVDIVGDWNDEYHFRVKDTSVDVSFLPICELWHFVVTPVAAGVVGYERRLVDHVPLPPTADLALRYFNIKPVDSNPRDLLLEWELMDDTYGDCTLRYRIVVEDQETGNLLDLYVSGYTEIIHNFSPCVAYEISIRAVNRAQPTIEGPRRYHYHEMPALAEAPPTLNSVELGATSADIKFNLEGFDNNRCPVRTLYVDGGTKFNISIPLTNTEGERPPVEVNLKGLTPDSMYLLKVSVENSGGISPPAQIAVQTLPIDPGRL